jgi:Domain of unknown function (DUF4397)
MKLRYLTIFALSCAAFALSGCDGGRKAPPKTYVRVANVAPSFAALRFQREQTDAPDDLAFKGASALHEYDEDTYDFYVYERSLTSTLGNSWTFSKQLDSTTEYLFVLAEVAGQVSPQIVEYPAMLAGSGDAQIAVVQADEGLAAVDVYLQPGGAGIAGATPLGSLAFLDRVAPQTHASGDYELTITPAGDPSNVLFTSTTLPLTAGLTTVFVITAENGFSTAALSVLMLQENPAALYSTDSTATVRVINAAADGQPRDFAVNNEFAPPLFSAIPYGTVTSDATVPLASELPINVTPVGNPGALELTSTLATGPAQQYTLVFEGDAGALTYNITTEDRRRIAKESKLQIFDAATQFTTGTEYVLLPPGTTDPSTVAAYKGLLAPSVAPFDAVAPGDYELLLRETVTDVVRAGPIPVTFAQGGLYTILTLNGPDTATANVVFLDDQPQ